MRNSSYRKLVTIFLAILSLLLLWFLLVSVGFIPWKIESYENRRLASFPTQVSSLDDWIKWPRRFESYLDDHLPTRNTLLRLNAWIKYHIFSTSPVNSVLVGKDGWLFHRVSDDLLEIEGRLQRQPYQIRRLRVILEERRDWLAEKGIDYMVLIAPTKQTIYPEKLPQWLKPSKSVPSRRQMLMAELQRVGSELKLFDFTPALQESKKLAGDALYYLQDSHWNYLGGAQGYTALSKKYPEWFIEPGSDWIEIQTPRDSNLMHLMGLSSSEITSYPQPPAGFVARTRAPDTKLLQNMASRGAVVIYQRPDGHGPRLYLMGDSFAGWDTAYLAENFSRTILTNTWGDQWQRHEQFPTENILAEHPNLVIEQMVENRLDLGQPRALLGDSAGENHPPEVRSTRLKRLMRASGELVVDYSQQGGEIEIPTPQLPNTRSYIVRLELKTIDKTTIQSISPYSDVDAWYDPCRRGGELIKYTEGPEEGVVFLCATAGPNTGKIRLSTDKNVTTEIKKISIAPHPDV
jgi:hypothetical protein